MILKKLYVISKLGDRICAIPCRLQIQLSQSLTFQMVCVSLFLASDRMIRELKLIARKSALEKTQLSDVLITDNLF